MPGGGGGAARRARRCGNPEQPGSLLAAAAIERATTAVRTLECERGHILCRTAVTKQRRDVGVHVSAARAIQLLEALPGGLHGVGWLRGLDHTLTTVRNANHHGRGMLHCVPMRSAVIAAAILLTMSQAGTSAAARTDGSAPSAQQIRHAVRLARVRELCGPPSTSATHAVIRIRSDPRAASRARLPCPALHEHPGQLLGQGQAQVRARLARQAPPSRSAPSQAAGRHQAGFTWQFAPPAFLSGTVTFEWRLGHKVIGHTTRRTAHGIKNVDEGDPRGYSTATCRISK